jgi:hypothetical protein
VICFRRWQAAPVNQLLTEWGHYLGVQDGPRMVLWYGLFWREEPIAVVVSGSPRGATCAGVPWERVVECARICARPDRRDVVRVALRCWRMVAAQDWADEYTKTIEILAAYSDSTRHPGNIYRTDGWTLYDEKMRGSGGQAHRSGVSAASVPKKLWIWRLPEPAMPTRVQLPLAGDILAP